MVRVVGIEPTLLTERVFETRASTNSATPALVSDYNYFLDAVLDFFFISLLEERSGRLRITLTAAVSIELRKCTA